MAELIDYFEKNKMEFEVSTSELVIKYKVKEYMQGVDGSPVLEHFDEALCEVRLLNNEEDGEITDDCNYLCISFSKLDGDYLLFLDCMESIRDYLKSLLDYMYSVK